MEWVVQVWNCEKPGDNSIERITLIKLDYSNNGVAGYEKGKEDIRLFIPYTSIRLISRNEGK